MEQQDKDSPKRAEPDEKADAKRAEVDRQKDRMQQTQSDKTVPYLTR